MFPKQHFYVHEAFYNVVPLKQCLPLHFSSLSVTFSPWFLSTVYNVLYIMVILYIGFCLDSPSGVKYALGGDKGVKGVSGPIELCLFMFLVHTGCSHTVPLCGHTRAP